MPPQTPPPDRFRPALYELRHLHRALSRLESIYAVNSPNIQDLQQNVLRRIRELDAQLGQSALTHDQQ